MTAPAKTARDTASEIAFLTRALKAPTLRESAGRLAERARAESWTHEEFLVACLQREVSARESHGGEGRIRAARFPARKSLEEFDFDHARGLKRDVIAHLGTLQLPDDAKARLTADTCAQAASQLRSHTVIGLGAPARDRIADSERPMNRADRAAAPRRSFIIVRAVGQIQCGDPSG